MVDFKKHFDFITDFILAELLPAEDACISYVAEDSHFLRFKEARVRQNGSVEQATVQIKLLKKNRSFSFNVNLHFDQDYDITLLSKAIQNARSKMMLLPEDPYFTLPAGSSTSKAVYKGSLLEPETIPQVILTPFQGYNFTGLYSQGTICEGVVNTKGANHWFETENFLLDFSVWLPNGRASKSIYAGRKWSDSEYEKKVKQAISEINILDKQPKILKPGKYKVFITGDALTELVGFFDGFGERSIRQGSSAYIALKEGRERFSPQFNLTQDFTIGLEPAFNFEGELAPEKFPLVVGGKLKNTLISARTAKQYGLKSNGCNSWESTTAISISGGKLLDSDILKELDTGIYISSFHYLNWSDPAVARVTGMTRHGCLWVENGKVVGPIADMRWDESMYNIFGANLLALTNTTNIYPNTDSYFRRATGGASLPVGILVKDFNCTL